MQRQLWHHPLYNLYMFFFCGVSTYIICMLYPHKYVPYICDYVHSILIGITIALVLFPLLLLWTTFASLSYIVTICDNFRLAKCYSTNDVCRYSLNCFLGLLLQLFVCMVKAYFCQQWFAFMRRSMDGQQDSPRFRQSSGWGGNPPVGLWLTIISTPTICAEDPLETYVSIHWLYSQGKDLRDSPNLGFKPRILAAFLKVFWDCMWWNPSIHMADFEFAGIYRRFLAIKVAKNWAFLSNQTCFSQKWILPTPWEYINIYIDYKNNMTTIFRDITLPSFLGLQSEVNDESWFRIRFVVFGCGFVPRVWCVFKSRPRANAKRTT